MTAGNTVKSFYNILKEIYIYLDLSIINTESTIFNETNRSKKKF